MIQSRARYAGKPGIRSNPEVAVGRCQYRIDGNFSGSSGAEANLREVLSIKPCQSAVSTDPKESIPRLKYGIHFVVREAVLNREIRSKVAVCRLTRIERESRAFAQEGSSSMGNR